MRKLMFLLATLCCCAHAEEIYKWKDANGMVHFGDRTSAPSGSEKLDVRAPPPSELLSEQEGGTLQEHERRFGFPAAPDLGAGRRSVPVDPSRVGRRCKGLIDEIMKVRRGEEWKELAREFEQACPAIEYECDYFRARPESNRCTWVERTGRNVLLIREYP